MSSNIRLIVVHGPYKGQTFRIEEGITTIGREQENKICLIDDHQASRNHCQILMNDGIMKIEDLGSMNGVSVNHKEVDNSVMLKISDHITVGNSVFEMTDLDAKMDHQTELAKTRFNLDKNRPLKKVAFDGKDTPTSRITGIQSQELRKTFERIFGKKR